MPPTSASPLDGSQHVDDCIDLARAAVEGGLLSSAASIEQALTGLGWTRARRSGSWNPPGRRVSHALSSLTPPSVEVQVGHEDDDALAAAGVELTDRLVALLGAPDSRGPVPGADQVEALWEQEELAVVVSFLPSWSTQILSAPDAISSGLLRMALSRPDVLDAEEDPSRARHLAEHGSSVERWHVAGQAPLPDDVVARLEQDADPTVVCAVRAGDRRREWLSSL